MGEIRDVLTADETLLRLLYYRSNNLLDSPLDESKPNIIGSLEYWDIVEDRIKFTPTTKGFDNEEKCRVCFYADRRTGQYNKLFKIQNIKFDVLVHQDIHNVDLRMYTISERINYLLRNKKFSSFGAIKELTSDPIGQVAEGYYGYSTLYQFGELYDK